MMAVNDSASSVTQMLGCNKEAGIEGTTADANTNLNKVGSAKVRSPEGQEITNFAGAKFRDYTTPAIV